MASPNAVDASVHACRAWASQHRSSGNKAFVKLDFSNAFNCVDRARALGAVRNAFPGLARWTQWCYACPSTLYFGTHEKCSASGVQQGDPLGPLLFAAAIQPMATELRGIEIGGSNLDLAAFYLDDGFFAGDVEVVSAALHLIQTRSPALGLALNLSKCELILPGASCDKNLAQLFPRSLLVDSDDNSRVRLQGNFDLLGAAIGDAQHCETFVAERVQAARPLLAEISDLEDPDVSLRLLRACGGHCKMVHTMRTTPPHLVASALGSFDTAVRQSFCKITGLMPDDAEWQQAGRSFKHAGLGLRQCSAHAPGTYLSSVGASRGLAAAINSEFFPSVAAMGSAASLALESLNATLPDEQKLALDDALRKKKTEVLVWGCRRRWTPATATVGKLSR